MMRRRLYGWHDPRDGRKRVPRSFHSCLALAFMIYPFFDNLRLRVSKIFGSLRFGRRDWFVRVIAEGVHEDSAEDIGSLAILYFRADAARGDPGFGAELLDSYNQLRRKAGQFRADGIFESIARDVHPLNAFVGGVEFEAISVIAKPLFSLSCSSGGVERHFKTRSRVSRKERLRLGEEKADMQSRISFNHKQLQRANSYLSKRRDGGMFDVLSRSPDDSQECQEPEKSRNESEDAETVTDYDSDDAEEELEALECMA